MSPTQRRLERPIWPADCGVLPRRPAAHYKFTPSELIHRISPFRAHPIARGPKRANAFFVCTAWLQSENHHAQHHTECTAATGKSMCQVGGTVPRAMSEALSYGVAEHIASGSNLD